MNTDRLAEGYEPNFDIDAAVGRQGELLFTRISEAIKEASAEVKTDKMSMRTKRVYLEYECMGRDGMWRPSGIQTTSSELWVYALGDSPSIAVVLPTWMIRDVGRRAYREGLAKECVIGSNPTKGVVIPLDRLLLWAMELDSPTPLD